METENCFSLRIVTPAGYQTVNIVCHLDNYLEIYAYVILVRQKV